jgi:alpha-galactosidase
MAVDDESSMTSRFLFAWVCPVAALGLLFLSAHAVPAQTGGEVLETGPGAASAITPEQVAKVPALARLQPVILPPDPKPAIHGPRIVGTTPGHPFLFRIPATGEEPLTFACANLPPGLALDPKTGIISGAMAISSRYRERYVLHLSVANRRGKATRVLALVDSEHPLALTPPMGWDAVNLYANTMDDAKTRAAADALVKSGLAAHGWSTIHVNDTWQGVRDKKTGEIVPNRRRFPDMKALGDYLHGLGLKFGLESAPTEHTCAGFPGSLGHAAQDAATYAGWGVDYLQYDWCPVTTLDEAPPPTDQPGAFKEMRSALNKTGRDIVLAADTFGERDPGDWAPGAGANTWVTSRQVFDDWNILTRALFDQPWTADRAGPGHWPNPGLLMVGKFGVGNVHATRLTPSQQMAQISQCALLSAPLWLSCDLTSLDPNAFHPSVTAMLTNDEVLDVDQDPAGHSGAQVVGNRTMQVWSKPLADGTVAVGLFNLNGGPHRLWVSLAKIGLTGAQPVRDLWMHQDLGDFTGAFATDLPAYGVALVKIGRPSEPK